MTTRFLVAGLVQGVGFRATASWIARRHPAVRGITVFAGEVRAQREQQRHVHPDLLEPQNLREDHVAEDELIKRIDEKLCELNDDYAVERTSALKHVFVQKLPEEAFIKFMESKGKLGSQHKFPRVLKGKMLQDWNEFLQKHNY